MKKYFLAVFLIFFCFINFSAQAKISTEEYKIYAVILKNIYRVNLKEYKIKSSFVILNNTFQPIDIDTYKIDKIKGLLNNFRRANETIAVLDKRIPVKFNYTIIDKSEIDELLKIGSKELEVKKAEYKKRNMGIRWGNSYVWKPFNEKFPNSNGYHQFSKIGFSSKRNFAVVYVDREAGFSNDFTIYILKKSKGNWTINFSYGWGGVS